MANPSDVQAHATGLHESDVIALVEQHNNLVDTVRALAAKLDADAGVSDADYAATLTDEAVATAPRKITL